MEKRFGQAVIAFSLLAFACTSPDSAIEEKYDEQWKIIVKHYVKKIPDTPQAKMECFQKILHNGLPGCLDPSSRYLAKEALQHTREEQSGTFGGVGLELVVYNNYTTVITAIDGTPAGRSGKFAPGDIVVTVDGTNVEHEPLESVVKRVRGKLGTKVQIQVERQGKRLPPITLTREEIKIQSVESKAIDPHITYVKVRHFIETTPYDFGAALAKPLDEDTSAHGFIIDLRNNPGGLLDAVATMSAMFSDVPTDIIVTEKSARDETSTTVSDVQRRYPDIRGIFKNVPVVLLVNNGSASASEIFAGVLRDWKQVKIVGEVTFGKGTVQQLFRLSGGEGMYLTTYEYFVGNSKTAVHGVGITPDHQIENQPRDPKETQHSLKKELVDLEHDAQLERALDVLRDEMH